MSKIVIVGGGFGGLEAARAARKENPNNEIVLIDQSPFMTYHAFLHEVVSMRRQPSTLEIDLYEACKKINVKFVNKEISNIEDDYLELDNEKIEFDACITALGSKTSFVIKGVRNDNEIKHSMQAIELSKKIQKIKEGNVLIVGAGLTGVELAAELGEYFSKCVRNVNVTLVEKNSDVMPGFPKLARKIANKELKKYGVKVITGKEITGNTQRKIFLDNDEVNYNILIWTSGVLPKADMNEYNLESTMGYLKVNEFLQSSNKKIFGVGDIAWVEKGNSHELWTAKTAIKEGNIAGINAARFLDNKPLIKYKPGKRHLFLISLGSKKAILTYGNFVFAGKIPLKMKEKNMRKFLEERT